MSNRQDDALAALVDRLETSRTMSQYISSADLYADMAKDREEAARAIVLLQARLDAAEKDAARYRWLRGKWINGQEETGLEPVMHCFAEDECDAALDGAMGAA